MSDDLNRLVKLSCYTAALVAFVSYLFKMEVTVEAIIGYAETGVTISAIVGILYERKLWRYDRLLNKPYIAGTYKCYLRYAHNKDGNRRAKECRVKIDQSLLTLSLKLWSDQTQSVSITAQLLRENEQDVLYYIYRTEPMAIKRQDNPSQYGGARLVIQPSANLLGQYWTSSKTIGDMRLNRIDQDSNQ